MSYRDVPSYKRSPSMPTVREDESFPGTPVHRPAHIAFALSSRVAKPYKMAVIVAVFANMFLFLWAAIVPSFEVVVPAPASAGATPYIESFSVFREVAALSTTGYIPMALVMLVTSFIWPQLKLAVHLFMWLAPVAEIRRDVWLFWAERTSVWALLGTCATVVLVVVLSTADKANERMAQSAGATNAAPVVLARPLAGTYVFCLAVVASLSVGAFIRHIHFRALADDEDFDWDLAGVKKPSPRGRPWALRHAYGRTWQASVALLMGSTIVLTLCGIAAPAYSVAASGYGLGKPEIERVSCLKTDWEAVHPSKVLRVHPHLPLGELLLGWLLSNVTIFLPLFRLASQVFIWFFSTDLLGHKLMLDLSEVGITWSGLEVFLAAVLLVRCRLGALSRSMVSCHDGACFGAEVRLAWGWWLGAVAALAGVALNILLDRLRVSGGSAAEAQRLINGEGSRGSFGSMGGEGGGGGGGGGGGLAGLKPASVKNFHATSSYGTISVRPVGENEGASSSGNGSSSWL